MMAPSTLMPSAGPPWPRRFSVPQTVATDRYGDRVLALDGETGAYVILRGTPLSAARFVRVAPRLQVLAETTHPKLATLLAFGHEQDHLWMATQYLVGRSVNEMLAEQGRLLLHEFVPIAAQVLMGLGHLHQRGIAVGAIRPEDVLVRDHRGRALVVTLHDLGAHGVLPLVVDDEAMRAGLLAEMPPEHATLDAVATVESDVFALGVLFHRLLSGTSPFVRAPVAGRELGVIARQAPRVDAGLPAGHGLPESLVVLVQQLLAPDPRDRPHDAEDVVERMIDCVPKALFRLPAKSGQATGIEPVAPDGSGALFLTGRFVALTQGHGSSSTDLPAIVDGAVSAVASRPGRTATLPAEHERLRASWSAAPVNTFRTRAMAIVLAIVIVGGLVAALGLRTMHRSGPSDEAVPPLAPAAELPREAAPREAQPSTEAGRLEPEDPPAASSVEGDIAREEGRVVIEVGPVPTEAALDRVRKPRVVRPSPPPSPTATAPATATTTPPSPPREKPPETRPNPPTANPSRPETFLDGADVPRPKKRSDELLPVNEDR